MLEQLRAGSQFVMGNRFAGTIEKGAMPFLNRYLGNPVLSYLGRLFFETKINDFQCGLRGFHHDAILSLKLCTPGMEYASEMVVSAALHNLKTSEVPVSLYKDKRGRPPHLKPWRDGWRYLRFLLIYCPRWLYIYPSILFMATGFLAFCLLMPGSFHLTKNITLDLHSLLLGSMMFTVGLQGLSFGFLARYYIASQGILPKPSKMNKITEALTLEKILITAFLLGVVGVTIVLYQINLWSELGFGKLYYGQIMRYLILAMTLFICSIQLAFSGFMLAIMRIRRD
jgi:hypothetical protein